MSKTYIVTGASDGLGKQFSLLALEKGASLICLCRTKPDFNCVHIPTDLTQESSIHKAVEQINESYSEFDALINCAGGFLTQDADDVDYEGMQRLFALNTLAPIYLTSRLFPLIVSNGADIINVCSTVGHKAYKSQEVYGATKWALRGATKNLQTELAKTACRVTEFSPGGMNTGFFDKCECDKPDLTQFMDPKTIAELMQYVLDIPKGIEISEIIINRKSL